MKKLMPLVGLLILGAMLAGSSPLKAQKASSPQLEKALDYYDAKLYDRALEACRQALRENPDDPGVHYLLGSIHAAQNRHREALEAFEKVASLSPESANSPDLQFEMGLAYLNLKRFGEAEKAFRKVVQAEPDKPRGHYGLVGALSGLGRTPEAEEEFQTLKKLDPALARKISEKLSPRR